ncbi:unnamed protein product [Polarella glacialis]|uniref:Uncharacterized protein n=1 Tax=Polarella glacialis TaxID=89957 RepID=A0A813GXN8_POLGL|nr:unnamed protein product [Polarella glacialis]
MTGPSSIFKEMTLRAMLEGSSLVVVVVVVVVVVISPCPFQCRSGRLRCEAAAKLRSLGARCLRGPRELLTRHRARGRKQAREAQLSLPPWPELQLRWPGQRGGVTSTGLVAKPVVGGLGKNARRFA